MKLFRLGERGRERPGATVGTASYDVTDLVGDFDKPFWQNCGTETLRKLIEAGEAAPLARHAIQSHRVGPPIVRPEKVVCIGLNYADHVAEAGADTPTEPVVFMKANNTVVGPSDDVLIPPGSQKTDYEVELAIIIGETCRYLPNEEAAMAAIGGYAVSNDVSERSYQLERGGQWVKGKSSETFNPLGPYLVTPDEIPDPHDLDLTLSVNGEQRQNSNTKQMIFSVAHIVWYLSQFMVLEPGDVINTGTPHGVALGLDESSYLRPGDEMELSIAGLGTQRQRCRQA